MCAQPMLSRATGWFQRYLPAELLGTAAALLCAAAALALSGSHAAALAGTWGESLAYYGMIIARDLRAAAQPSALGPKPSVLATLRGIALEFGPAELLDSAIIRPAALYAGLSLSTNPAAGLLAGKLLADMIFYLPTIASYELLRRRAATERTAP